MIQTLLATLRQGWHKLESQPSQHHGPLLALPLVAIKHSMQCSLESLFIPGKKLYIVI
jgi:hypothetical protein